MKVEKVVITGIGVVSSAGFQLKEFLENLCSGKDMFHEIQGYPIDKLRTKKAAQIIEDLPIMDHWKGYSRAAQMALIAGQHALIDAGIYKTGLDSRIGLSIATMTSGVPEFESNLLSRDINLEDMNEDIRKQFSSYDVVNVLSKELEVYGIRSNMETACSSGTACVGRAYNWIKRGKAKRVLCGSVDSFSYINHVYLSSLRIIAKEKLRPFDDGRTGMLLGEGAAMFMIESLESALSRDANIYAEIEGYGFYFDADDLMHPDVKGIGLQNSIRMAMNEAGAAVEEIVYINAHGTGTLKNDEAEIEAYKSVFKEALKDIYVSSIKGCIGHAGCAAGALELASVLIAMKEKIIPPTTNFRKNMTAMDINFVPTAIYNQNIQYALSNSVGLGGNNSSILVRGY